MRKVFDLDVEKGIMKAYQLADEKSLDLFKKELLNSSYRVIDREEKTFTTDADLGQESLVWLSKGKIAIRRKTGEEYLGQKLLSNIGVASHGCDHYYGKSYSYSYTDYALTNELLKAVVCLYNTIYYGEFNENEAMDWGHKNIYNDEVKALQYVKEILNSIPDTFDYNFSNDILRIISHALGVIRVKTRSYNIKSVEDLEKVFCNEHYFGKYCVSLFLNEMNFSSVNEILSVVKNDKILSKEGLLTREMFRTFPLTKEWLAFANEVNEKEKKLLSLWRKRSW